MQPKPPWESAEAALLDLSAQSALLRAYKAGENGQHVPVTSNRSTAFIAMSQNKVAELERCVRGGMAKLARFMRETGQDARDCTGWWNLLEEKDSYVEPFEHNRRVDVDELTPLAIYTCITRSNKLVWQGWTVFLGGSREVTDDFGMPAWERRVWVCSPAGEVELFGAKTKETARAIYRHIVGKDFDGDDQLGFDPLHPAGGPCWWDDEAA